MTDYRKNFFRILAVCVFIMCFLWPTSAHSVESSDFSIAFQGGALYLDGKLGKILSPDVGYGAGAAWGFTDHFALVLDFLYSEHQQSDEDKYGRVSFTHGAGSLGLRAAHTFKHVMPYIEAAPLGVFMRYKANYPMTDSNLTQNDSLNSHGFGGTGAAGLDIFIASGTTLGFAGRVGIVQTDMNFATGADVDNSISAYTFYAGLVRMTMLF